MLGDLLLKANRPHESAYQSYRGGEGGDLSMGHATCRADVVRARWSKWTTVIIHRLHLAKALVAYGFATVDVDRLPLGHPGHDEQYGADYGNGYSLIKYIAEKMDRIIVGDETDIAMGYAPSKGGQNKQLYDAELDRLMVEFKGLGKISAMYCMTLSKIVLPPLYIYASGNTTTDGNVAMPVCMGLHIFDVPWANNFPCDCRWRYPDGRELKRSKVRTMSFALAERSDPEVRRAVVGRRVSRCVPMLGG